ncbi:Cytochrome P450 CYP4/CYP19/CYP26 subfamily [Handroanthus impetiginosus]|uniref:Cytochrome P450 CYP4/CYP19/CYP26 subfamily n=1 Tax=Handroanthus impetiginosus TaxID=429701 RepID=A0A2G9GGW1_9LAMI|nr:Cytochrome P450 CYP4/CYP19/CYP26 subfamily [Handroanthus impetiginosus]
MKNLYSMTIFEYYHIFLIPLFIFLFLRFIRIRKQKKGSAPTNWPILGMLPAALENIHRIHDYATEVLSECGGTFEFKGPWFSNMDMLVTCDPANIHHIFSKNFSNYPKGNEFRKIFEVLGEGIFSSDFELWELHRSVTLSLISQAKFYSSLERTLWETIERGLFPVLNHFSEKGTVFDMQDILQRVSFDSICKLLLDYDPDSLSTDLACEKALSDALEPLFYRHAVPKSIWKLQKWLKIGNEKKLVEAWKAFDDFIYPLISAEREDNLNILTAFRKAYEKSNIGLISGDLRHFLRDSLLGLLFAGRDGVSTTLTWFFWLLSKNPSVEIKIREEIETCLDNKWRFFNIEESRKLVYLHAALCETLRFFPPIGLELKAPLKLDILPSGNYVHKNTKVIIAFYSTGRMEDVWGKDCMEFKPERWISARGGVKHEPTFKFPAFNAGPRTCIGKQMAFIQMKMVAAAIMYHYNVQVVEDHQVSPRCSIMLKTKHGLRVRLSRKESW